MEGQRTAGSSVRAGRPRRGGGRRRRRDSPQGEGELQLFNDLGSEREEPGGGGAGRWCRWSRWCKWWSINSKDTVSEVSVCVCVCVCHSLYSPRFDFNLEISILEDLT